MPSPRPTPVGWLLLPLTFVAVLAVLWWLSPGPGVAPPMAPGTSTPAAPAAARPTAPTDAAPAAPAPATDLIQRTDAAPRAPQLTGRLVQNGRPLANVTLRLCTNSGHMPVATDHTLLTREDGTFATEGLATTFWFVAETDSVPSEWRTPSIAPLQEDHDLGDVEPPPAMTLDVQVVDEPGNPVPQARCWASRNDVYVDVGLAPADPRTPRCVHGDANGRVRLERLHPGPLHVKVDADGLAMTMKMLDLDPEQPPGLLRLRLTRGGWLEGRVFDWRDRPLPGATVRCEGRATTTNEEGNFVLRPFGGTEAVQFVAAGHQPEWLTGELHQGSAAHVRLKRAVVLRGIVHGGNAATAIVLAPAEFEQGLPWPGPFELLKRPLPVAADGTFAIEGLEATNYRVHARAEGLGASASQLVKLRDDTAIELTIEPAAAIDLRVVDAEGQPVAPLELVCNQSVLEYPSLFDATTPNVQQRLFDEYGRTALPARGERVRVAVPPNEPFALGVRSPGFLAETRTFEAGKAPPELTIVLQRAATLRGVVRGGEGAACGRSVALWQAADDAAVRARTKYPQELPVDAQGRFRREGLLPGDWFAAVTRDNRACLGHRPYEQPGASPLVDEAVDLRGVVAFAMSGGAATELVVEDPPLGTLRGRVLQAGRPVAGAWVVAGRPGARLFEHVVGSGEAIDWNSATDLQYVPGQRTGADGSFVFLYRDAGPLEVRVRHADGAATMPPVVVDLPPPGRDVVRDLELAGRSVRGRFVAPATGEPVRGAMKAVLFPLDKAAGDPFFSTDWSPSIAFSCARCRLGADGDFAFAQVPDGTWVVRVTDGFRTSFAHRLVVVAGDDVELGELRPAAQASAKFSWHWREGTSPRQIGGVWLFEANGGRPAIWVGTFDANATGAECAGLPAGKYLGVVFGGLGDGQHYFRWGTFGEITGTTLSEPFAIELRADGTTVPAKLELLPAAEKR